MVEPKLLHPLPRWKQGKGQANFPRVAGVARGRIEGIELPRSDVGHARHLPAARQAWTTMDMRTGEPLISDYYHIWTLLVIITIYGHMCYS